ncbi:MAG: S8 family peptidase [Thermodesulfobacteriota bacterium]
MLLPEEKCESRTELNFHQFLRALKQADKTLYNLAVRKINHKNFHLMMAEIGLQKPEVYDEIVKLIKAMEAGETTTRNSPETDVLGRAWEIARDLVKTYDCAQGFLDAPKKIPVTVYLKIPEVVIGLPKEIMAMSNNLARDYDGRRKWTMGFDNRVFVTDLEPAAIEEMRKNPLVEKVVIEPEAHIMMAGEIPTYNPSGVNTDWGVSRINPIFAWAKEIYGQGIKVCVIDTGIKKEHECFWKNGVSVYKGGYNILGGNDNPADDHDHGTYCCSIVAAQHNAIAGSYRGIAPGIELYAVKVMDSKGSGSFANIAAGIDWARTHGMDILSLSVGGPQSSDVLKAACDAAWYAGCLVVASAGNSGPDPNTVDYPAKYASVIAVAAVDVDEIVADFSSRGEEVELSAPGKKITGAWAGFTYSDYVVPGSGNRYMTASGTSAACPHVSAAAALIKNWYPLATNIEIRLWLKDYARDL